MSSYLGLLRPDLVSGEGKASRYYPRIITSALWMES